MSETPISLSAEIGKAKSIDDIVFENETVYPNNRLLTASKMGRGKIAESKITSRSRLYLAAFSANLLFISSGCALTWTSPAIPKLRDNGNFSENEITWISSVQPIGAIFGPALYSFSIDRVGRKGSLILNAASFLLSWFLLAISDNCVSGIGFGRFIGGIGVGASFNSIPVYITEISDVDSRQTLTSLTELFISIGYVLTYSAGPYVDFKSLAIVCSLPAILFILIILPMPESPYYYISIAKREEADKVLVWLRKHPLVKDEIDLIQAEVDEAKENTGKKKDLFLKKGPRMGLILTLLMLFTQQVSAVDVITTYTEPIFNETNVPLSPSTSAIVVGVVNLMSSFGALPAVYFWGSKPVLVGCAFICGLALHCFGTYKYLEDNKICDLSNHIVKSIPLISILVFNVFFCIGLGSLPWAIAAELFPPSQKGFALLLSSGLAWCCSFLLIYSYGSLNLTVGISTLFFTYGTCVIIGSILILLFVPNTTGKTLKEVTDKLENRKVEKDPPKEIFKKLSRI